VNEYSDEKKRENLALIFFKNNLLIWLKNYLLLKFLKFSNRALISPFAPVIIELNSSF
jgi:hypothetical protein